MIIGSAVWQVYRKANSTGGREFAMPRKVSILYLNDLVKRLL